MRYRKPNKRKEKQEKDLFLETFDGRFGLYVHVVLDGALSALGRRPARRFARRGLENGLFGIFTRRSFDNKRIECVSIGRRSFSTMNSRIRSSNAER